MEGQLDSFDPTKSNVRAFIKRGKKKKKKKKKKPKKGRFQAGNNTAVCCEGMVGQTKVAPRSGLDGSAFVYRRGKCVWLACEAS
jgi:hypothetical protein